MGLSLLASQAVQCTRQLARDASCVLLPRRQSIPRFCVDTSVPHLAPIEALYDTNSFPLFGALKPALTIEAAHSNNAQRGRETLRTGLQGSRRGSRHQRVHRGYA